MLDLRLGAARARHDAVTALQLEDHEVRRRVRELLGRAAGGRSRALGEVAHRRDADAGDLAGRIGAHCVHDRSNARRAVRAGERDRDLRAQEHAVLPPRALALAEQRPALALAPRRHVGHDRGRADAVFVSDERPDRVAERFLVAEHEAHLRLATEADRFVRDPLEPGERVLKVHAVSASRSRRATAS